MKQVIAWGRGVFTRFPDHRHTVRTVLSVGCGRVVVDRRYHDRTLVP